MHKIEMALTKKFNLHIMSNKSPPTCDLTALLHSRLDAQSLLLQESFRSGLIVTLVTDNGNLYWSLVGELKRQILPG